MTTQPQPHRSPIAGAAPAAAVAVGAGALVALLLGVYGTPARPRSC